MMVQFLHPQMLLLMLPAAIILALLIRKDFVRFRSQKERLAFEKTKAKKRTLIFISRLAIFASLIVAVASPFQLNEMVTSGNPTLTIFVDKSDSMQLMDTSEVNGLIGKLEGKIPVTVKTLASGNKSAIGNSLLAGIKGNDNVLLVTDGNSNYGRSFGDMMVLAATLNSSISALNLNAKESDSAVIITGPRVTTPAEDNDFDVAIKQVGAEQPYELTVTIDGKEVLSETFSGSKIATITSKFSEGYHTIKAETAVNDYFSQNNIYYKTVEVQPKPSVLFITESPSPFSDILKGLYDTTTAQGSSGYSLDGYSAVVLNDISAASIDVAALSSYVIDGNGLVAIGGKNSYDKGDYKDSLFEGMLPVVVGKGVEGEKKDVSIALVIDISGSTGAGFGKSTASTVEEVEKALATGILADLRKNDKVAVIAFNTQSYIVSELGTLLLKERGLSERIATLKYFGGTQISAGIFEAVKMLAPLEGSRNIILLSDGKSGNYAEDLFNAGIAANTGIKIYTIGVGEGTNRQHMQDIAAAGNGYYFEPSERERLRILFGETEKAGTGVYALEIINNHHFVTQGLDLQAGVQGFNQVVPKLHADLLVATQGNNPIITASRLGLGRIVAYSTDDGSAWSSEMLNSRNSVLVARTVNWAIGDLGRNKAFDVNIKDVYLGDEMQVNVISDSEPSHPELKFAKLGKRLYSASTTPESTGVYEFLGGIGAVNYEREYLETGMNANLEDAISVANGKMFEANDENEIIDKVIKDSKRIVAEPVSYSWIFLIIALAAFLAEIILRRIEDGKQK